MSHRSIVVLGVFLSIGHPMNSAVSNLGRTDVNRNPSVLPTGTRGAEHGCALDTDGRAMCWGSNRLGQLGDDAASRKSSTRGVMVATTEKFVVISAGANHTCALTLDGAVYCWGLNLTRELGQALVANDCDRFPCSRRPVRLETSLRSDTVSAGFGHTCALSKGRAFCCGRNDRGQLGSARADDSCEGVGCNVSPVRVEGIDRFASISAGGDHTCGVEDGAAYCWGSNQYGQLGAPPEISFSARPLRVPVTERVIAVEARGIYTCLTLETGMRRRLGTSMLVAGC